MGICIFISLGSLTLVTNVHFIRVSLANFLDGLISSYTLNIISAQFLGVEYCSGSIYLMVFLCIRKGMA